MYRSNSFLKAIIINFSFIVSSTYIIILFFSEILYAYLSCTWGAEYCLCERIVGVVKFPHEDLICFKQKSAYHMQGTRTFHSFSVCYTGEGSMLQFGGSPVVGVTAQCTTTGLKPNIKYRDTNLK